MKKLKLKRNDIVKVTSGRDRGKQGKIFRVFSERDRILVEGINLVAKHERPTRDNPKGGIIHREAPLHISNVMLLDPATQKPTRVGFTFLADGSKKRIAKKSKELIG